MASFGKWRRLPALVSASLLLLLPSYDASAHTTDLKARLAKGERFISLISLPPKPDVLPSQADLNSRFGDGIVAYGANDTQVLRDAAFQGHIARVNIIMSRLLAAYTAGPKPARIPFVIVSTNDVNCAITPVAPEQYRSSISRMAQLANGAAPIDLAVRRVQSTGPDTPDTRPIAMEMRCSKYFLDQVTSDEEMAFITAHELSHVLLGHWRAGDSEIRQKLKTDGALESGLGLIAAVQNMEGHSGGLMKAANPGFYNQTRAKLSGANYMLNEYNVVIRGPAWQREQERDADILALDLLYKAGYSRAGSWQIMNRAANAQAELNRKSNYFDNLFKSASAQMVLGITPDQFSLMSNVKNTAVNVGGSMIGHFRDARIQKVHDDAAVRTKAVVEYEQQHPVTEKMSQAAADFFGGNSFAKASAPIAAANDFVAAIQVGSCDTLAPETAATLKSMTAKKRRTQTESEALYVYWECKGNNARALTYASEAAAGPSRSSAYFINQILALIKVKQYAKANTVIADATRLAPPYDQYVFLDIQVKMLLKQTPRAVKIAEACYVTLRYSNPSAAYHCLSLAQIDESGQHVEPDAPPPEIKTDEGVVAGGKSVVGYTAYSVKKRAKSVVRNTKRVFGMAENELNSGESSSSSAAPEPPPAKKKKPK